MVVLGLLVSPLIGISSPRGHIEATVYSAVDFLFFT